MKRFIVVRSISDADTNENGNKLYYNFSGLFPYNESEKWLCKLEKCVLTPSAPARFYETDFITVACNLANATGTGDGNKVHCEIALFENKTMVKAGTVGTGVDANCARTQQVGDSWEFLIYTNNGSWGSVEMSIYGDDGSFLLEDDGGDINEGMFVFSFTAVE